MNGSVKDEPKYFFLGLPGKEMEKGRKLTFTEILMQ